MQIDVTKPLVGFDGEVAKKMVRIGDEFIATDEDLLLRSVLFQCLDNEGRAEPPRSAEDKERAFKLMCMIMVKDTVEVTNAEAAFIKKCSGFVNPPLPHGRICEAIEAATLAFTEDEQAKASKNGDSAP